MSIFDALFQLNARPDSPSPDWTHQIEYWLPATIFFSIVLAFVWFFGFKKTMPPPENREIGGSQQESRESTPARRKRLYQEAAEYARDLELNQRFDKLPQAYSEVIHESRRRTEGVLVQRYHVMPCKENYWKGWQFTVEGGVITKIKLPSN